jgi:imidazolonepropionase-like amidohydrolase
MRFMKQLFAVSLGIALGAAVIAPVSQQTPATAFVGAGVLTMEREGVLRDHTVIVRGGRIEDVGPVGAIAVPAGAIRIDASGKFLMPALAEMHAHIPPGKAPDEVIERTLFLYAANGIGTIRGMLGDPRHLGYRNRAEKGEIVSPRIYTSGPSLNGDSVPTVADAMQAVTSQKEAGYDLLKIHPGVKRDVFDALAAKAKEVGIPFAGHVPLDVGLHRALEAKYATIDHLDGYVEALAKNPAQSQFFGINLINEVDEAHIPALIEQTKAAGTWMVPTEVLFVNLLNDEDAQTMAQRPEMKYAQTPQVVQNWIGQKQKFAAQFPSAERQKYLALRRSLIKRLHGAGVPFLLGSDAPQMWNVPGFSIHRELQVMVAAGLTPYDALRSGTANVATHFKTNATAGTVAKGKRADLVLLDANPLDDIANSSKIAGVMLNGRWISKAEIDKRLESGK